MSTLGPKDVRDRMKALSDKRRQSDPMVTGRCPASR
jgi:hypothetical protein